MRYATDTEAKAMICEYGRRMYDKSLVVGTAGNISCRVEDNAVWTTPTGVCKGYMTPEMLVKMDLEGNILNRTDFRPSSESKMHLAVYQENAHVQGVVHGHPIFASGFAIVGKALTVPLLIESLLIGDHIPVAPFALPASIGLADTVKPFCQNYKGVLLANHGALTWDTTLENAFFMMEMLENYCQIITFAKLNGDPAPIAQEDVERMKKALGL